MILTPTMPIAMAAPLMIKLPLTFLDSLAPILAPAKTPMLINTVCHTTVSRVPSIICSIVPAKAETARVKWEVAVAICTGKFNMPTSTGT